MVSGGDGLYPFLGVAQLLHIFPASCLVFLRTYDPRLFLSFEEIIMFSLR